MSNKFFTRDEAHELMKQGKKVKHASFTSREFLHMPCGFIIRCEDNCNFEEGWEMRRGFVCGCNWDIGWSIYEPK